MARKPKKEVMPPARHDRVPHDKTEPPVTGAQPLGIVIYETTPPMEFAPPETPSGSVTLSTGISTGPGPYTMPKDCGFYQRVVGDVCIIWDQVPWHVLRNILNSRVPDTVIAQQLVGYPKRVIQMFPVGPM